MHFCSHTLYPNFSFQPLGTVWRMGPPHLQEPQYCSPQGMDHCLVMVCIGHCVGICSVHCCSHSWVHGSAPCRRALKKSLNVTPALGEAGKVRLWGGWLCSTGRGENDAIWNLGVARNGSRSFFVKLKCG